MDYYAGIDVSLEASSVCVSVSSRVARLLFVDRAHGPANFDPMKMEFFNGVQHFSMERQNPSDQ